MFVKTKSFHDQDCIQSTQTSPEVCEVVQRIIRANHMDSEAYKLRSACRAFLQGCEPKEGWILVEFWTEDQPAIDAFIDYVNKCVGEVMTNRIRQLSIFSNKSPEENKKDADKFAQWLQDCHLLLILDESLLNADYGRPFFIGQRDANGEHIVEYSAINDFPRGVALGIRLE